MNRNYGKLNLGGIEYGPDTLTINGRNVYNPQAVHYRIAGYLPVIDEMPETPPAEGWHYEPRGWELRPDPSAPSGVYRVYAAVQDPPPPPREFSKLKVVAALTSAGVWPQVKSYVEQNGLYDLYLAAQDFCEDNPYFVSGKAQLMASLGWTEEQAEAILQKCVIG